ncbi:MAG TPA: ferrous iron transport protein B [Cytophagaceae bacterium]|nr:ferrous iron transport protein B [Cytophagaceae bacterium]
MAQRNILKIALLGNPNSGKSSLFNHLTGLNQKIGNFPGVTVDKKTGLSKINQHLVAEIIDLPGTYSLYPKSLDEQIVFDFLNSPNDVHYPDFLVVVVDVSNLKRNLLLFTQVRDLGFPVILALNMLDIAKRTGTNVDVEALKKELGVPVVTINARNGQGVDLLKTAISCPVNNPPDTFLNFDEFCPELLKEIKEKFNIKNNYLALQIAHRYKDMDSLSQNEKKTMEALLVKYNFNSVLLQSKETVSRYEVIHEILAKVEKRENAEQQERMSSKIDKVLTHKIGGYFIFFLLLFLMFQAVFAWAAVPMDLIDHGIASVNDWLNATLPPGPLTSLLTEGLIAGLGGILIFIPQIAILFAFIAILEESGYMSRVMFLMDKIMRQFGLNGRSVVPLISGVACAVPAIMATRNIDNWKERLVTIFVTPLMSCSARIPVFAVLIGLILPEKYIWGIFNLQGLALMGLYMLGFIAAIVSALVMSKILKTKEKSYFIMEFPTYKIPRWKNIGITIVEKVKAFVLEAGKVILAISVVLWVLASYGPSGKMNIAEERATMEARERKLSEQETNNLVAARKLEYSYAGYFGRFIEPTIKPLGFDWKIGIALITSFAAREVFIGTMATIYSVGDQSEDQNTIIQKMRSEKNAETGLPVYTIATCCSLLVFYLFAMQCMSTLAIVYRETKSWKWPLIQFVYMTGLAYVSSLIIYQLLK